MLRHKVLAKVLLPKYGYSENECEDAFCIRLSRSKKTLKIAVADGATESSFSKEWANILVEKSTTLRALTKKMLLNNLSKYYADWELEVGRNPLPWYAEIKLAKGAFSTLLALAISLKKKEFSSFAIGDCCWFHIRKDELIGAFPVALTEEYHNHPFLLKSKHSDNIEVSRNIKEVRKRKILEGDYLFIMSDAISDWFSTQSTLNEKPWNILLGLFEKHNNIEFRGWLNKQRRNKLIKNDDTTLIILNFN